MTPTIDILLATYNGARYLPAQIRSVQNQTWTDWRMLVHDDGSDDDTLAVLQAFAAQDKRITIVEDSISFHSPARNFLHLLRLSSAPFAIFCDQDDIWLENKLERLHQAISVRDNSRPQGVYCNAHVYDCETGAIGGSAVLCQPRSLGEAFFMNGGVQGCSILFNAALRDICADAPEYVCMHDHLVTLAALAFGDFTYIDAHLMLYRRYKGAVTGKTYGTFKERLGVFFMKNKGVLYENHLKAIKSFHARHAARLSPELECLFQKFFRYENRSRLGNAAAVLRDGFRLYNRRSILVLKMLTRPIVGKDI